MENVLKKTLIISVAMHSCWTYFPTASQSLADEYALGLFCSVIVGAPNPVPVPASPSGPDGTVEEEEGRR